jgi:hypothetical protein
VQKSPEEIKRQIEFWFLKYYDKDRKKFNGTEVFTLFDLLEESTKDILSGQVNLRETELPVLILRISENQIIINTTERFIQLTNSDIEDVEYADFEWHNGYDSILATRLPNGKPVSVKTDGHLSTFGLRKRNGEIVGWKIPTGSPGFGFWNVTKKCELIGRKYLKQEK